MTQKTANIYVRIEPDIKKQAEDILSSLGVSASSAITYFAIMLSPSLLQLDDQHRYWWIIWSIGIFRDNYQIFFCI